MPKGPCLDPTVKRMAVQVEDHPLAYAGFEGTIPPKQYGAGTVIVWDRGEWVAEGDPRQGLAEGKLKFELRGDKLRGRWTLVRMRGKGEKQEPWLLIKESDDEARPLADYDVVAGAARQRAERPGRRRPAGAPPTAAKPSRRKKAATQAKRRPAARPHCPPRSRRSSPRWSRRRPPRPTTGSTNSSSTATACWPASTATRCSASRATATTGRAKLPALAKALAKLPTRSAWLDGEIVVAGEQRRARLPGAAERLRPRRHARPSSTGCSTRPSSTAATCASCRSKSAARRWRGCWARSRRPRCA